MPQAIVTAKAEAGFWRCGRHWPATPTEAEVSERDLGLLAKEPMLVVKVTGEPDDARAKARSQKDGAGKGKSDGDAPAKGESPKQKPAKDGEGPSDPSEEK